MDNSWQDLTDLTGEKPFAVERVRLLNEDIAIEGSFDLPPLTRLSAEDQVFVMAFVQSHGSIKRMEALFGISYPTVKNRLNRIAGQFEFVITEQQAVESHPPTDVIGELERGEITVDKAIEQLSR
jgi:hypothetical protein